MQTPHPRLFGISLSTILCLFLIGTAAAASGGPGPVTNLQAVHNGSTVSATWDAPAGAVDFHITYSTTNGQSWEFGAIEYPASAFIVHNTDSAKSYIVGVRARNDQGQYGPWRNSSSAAYTPPQQPAQPTPVPPTATPAVQAPGPVTNLQAVHNGSSVTATWDAPSGAEYYHATYSTNGGQSWQLAGYEFTGNSITFKAKPGSRYLVGVRAGNAGGWCNWRNSSEAVYTQAISAPTATPANTPTMTPTPAAVPTSTPTSTPIDIGNFNIGSVGVLEFSERLTGLGENTGNALIHAHAHVGAHNHGVNDPFSHEEGLGFGLVTLKYKEPNSGSPLGHQHDVYPNLYEITLDWTAADNATHYELTQCRWPNDGEGRHGFIIDDGIYWGCKVVYTGPETAFTHAAKGRLYYRVRGMEPESAAASALYGPSTYVVINVGVSLLSPAFWPTPDVWNSDRCIPPYMPGGGTELVSGCGCSANQCPGLPEPDEDTGTWWTHFQYRHPSDHLVLDLSPGPYPYNSDSGPPTATASSVPVAPGSPSMPATTMMPPGSLLPCHTGTARTVGRTSTGPGSTGRC